MIDLNLKINDMVLVTSGSFCHESISKIRAITKGGNYKVDNQIFNKDGYERGSSGSWHRDSIRKARREDFDRIKKKNIINILSKYDWGKKTLTELELIKEAINKFK